MTVPLLTAGGLALTFGAFLPIQSRATRRLSSVPALFAQSGTDMPPSPWRNKV